MKYRKVIIIIYIIGVLFLVACTKTATVNTKILPNNSGKVIGDGEYQIDTIVTLQAQPNKDFVFTGWEANDQIISEEKNYKFTIKSDQNLVAKFEPKEFVVELESTIKSAKLDGEGRYHKGKEVNIKAESLEEYNFLHWEDENGDVFSTKKNVLITINEDIYLRAIYLKKEPPSYLGFSEEEVLKKVNTAFYSYFETFDQHYGISNDGKYYIDLKPNIPIGQPSKFITHQIQVDDNAIIVKSGIKLPVLKKSNNVEAIKDDFKNNIKDIKDLNKFLSNSVEFDESNTVTYNREIYLIKKDDDLVIKHIDKPDGIFLEYQNLYKEVYLDNISGIDINIEENKIKNMVMHYDGEAYTIDYNTNIYNNRILYPKINFLYGNGRKLQLSQLHKKLNDSSKNGLIIHSELYDQINFYEIKDDDKLLIEISYTYGMDPNTVFSVYDDKSDDFTFTNKLQGLVVKDSLEFSKDNQYISVLLSDSSGKSNLEIINLLNQNTIKLLDLLEHENVIIDGTPIFKNVKWNTSDNKIEFECYSHFYETANSKESTLFKGKFSYNLNSKEISRIIKNIEDYESISVETRAELINLIDSSIQVVEEVIADVMIYDLVNKNNRNTFIEDYDKYMEYYFGQMSHTDFDKLLYSTRKKAKADNLSKFDDKYDLYDSQKRLILDYMDNKTFKERLSRYYDHYYGFKSTEGGYIKQIDYIEVKEDYGKYLSDEFNKYLDLKVEEIINRLRFEVYVLLTPDELATRMIKYESFLKTADNKSLKKDIKESYMECLSVLLKPRHIISYLNEYHQATYEYRMALDRLMKNDTAEVTRIAASKMFEFVYSKEDFILRSYSDDSEIKNNYEDILSNVQSLLNEKYFTSN